MNFIKEVITVLALQDTWVKAQPIPSTSLSESQKILVKAGTEINITDYGELKDGHYQVKWDGASLLNSNSTSWLWHEHFELPRPVLYANKQTFLKSRPDLQAAQLPTHERIALGAGSALQIQDAFETRDNHVKVRLVNPIINKVDWWCYTGGDHVTIVGGVSDQTPAEPEDATDLNSPKDDDWIVSVPGISQLAMNNPVHSQLAPNIFWYELLHGNQNTKVFRRPVSTNIVKNLIELAKDLQFIRNHYDKPMIITSGYRDPVTNRRVGGARRSRHTLGQAADFRIAGVHPRQVANWLASSKLGNNGIGDSARFTHYDTRGYRARWNYGR